MEQIQSELAKRTVEATSGGGVAVKVITKCNIAIASNQNRCPAINPADAQLLEDVIVTAANQALGQASDFQQQGSGKATAGFNLPGLM